MSAPANVLAVMDDLLLAVQPADLVAARDAVAELIEAANRVATFSSSAPTVAVSTEDIARLRRALNNAGAAP